MGGVPLRSVSAPVHDQYHGILSPDVRRLVEDLGVDAYVNLTAMKAGVVQSYLAESLIQAGSCRGLSSDPVPTCLTQAQWL